MERVRMHPKVYEAAKSGDYHSLMTIVSEDGEDLSPQTTPKGNNFLHVAAQYQQVNLIKDLLRHPSGPSLLWQGNYKGDTPLHVAANVGSHEAVRVFADIAKSPGQPDACKELLRRLNLHEDTALHYAIRGGHIGVVKLLIEEDPQLCDINNAAHESPLYLAAHRRLSDIVELILSAFSSSSSYKGPKGLTAMHVAIDVSLPSWWKILEKRPEVIREGDDIGWTPLHYVTCFGKVEAAQLLLQQDTSVAYVVDKEGQSAIHVAAFRGRVGVMDELLRSCPDACDIMNTKGQTALHAAVLGGRVNVVEYILQMPNPEDLINEQDTDRNTALHLAALHKQFSIIYTLAGDKRVDRLAPNKDHLTALDIFSAHKEVGYRAAKVRHVLKNSGGSLGLQGWVTEYVKKRLDKQFVEGRDPSRRRFIKHQLLVAVLIATVTFAAAFTMPGGYNNDGPKQGMATLASRAAFQAFVITNTIAFTFSILSLFLQYDSSWLSDQQQARYAGTARLCIYLAVIGMVLAFSCGTYVVLTGTIGIGIIPCVMSGCLMVMYAIGTYLDPNTAPLGMPGSSGRCARSLLFDYGIL